MDKLLAYINALPKDKRPAFCTAVGTSEGYLRKACHLGQKLDAALVARIELATRRSVRAEDVRPDVQWSVFRRKAA